VAGWRHGEGGASLGGMHPIALAAAPVAVLVGAASLAAAAADPATVPDGARSRLVSAAPSSQTETGGAPPAAVGSLSRAPRGAWRWPLAPATEVVGPFRAPASAYGPGHRGVDLAAAPGQPVVAVAPGRVAHAGVVAGRGTVTVLHRSGIASTYEPVVVEVRAGQDVAAGERIGSVDRRLRHCTRGPCLHLGARRGRAYLDPLALLHAGPVVLLPLGPGGPG
jgi:murein DD-endopeptidase MepM/ murein hydrolase activator NlpD